MNALKNWLHNWWDWSRAPGLAPKVIGFGLPMIVVVGLIAPVANSEDNQFEELTSSPPSLAGPRSDQGNPSLKPILPTPPLVPESIASPESYMGSVLPLLDDYSDYLFRFSNYLQEAEGNVPLLVDEDWRKAVLSALRVLQMTAEKIGGLEAPACFSQAHESLLNSLAIFDEAYTQHIDALSGGHEDGLDSAAVSMIAGAASLSDAHLQLMVAASAAKSEDCS